MEARIVKNHAIVPASGIALVRSAIPNIREAEVQGERVAAMPHTIETARILNNLGIKTPSPIKTQYKWPGRYRPRWYQEDTAEFLTVYQRGYCLSGMRTGKTLSSLWGANYLQEIGLAKRVLIVAPLSTLWDVWEKEIFASFPLRTFCVLHGDREKRLKLLAQPHDFYIVNHHGVSIIEAALRDRPDINLLIFDEAAVYRNSRTELWKRTNQALNGNKFFRAAWALTGSPTPNEPTDAYGISKLITPENIARRSFTSFKHETMLQISQYKWVPKKDAAEAVAKILKPAIRFERSVCTDMAPCFIERRTELSPEQKMVYTQLRSQAASQVRGSTVTAINAAVLLSKLIQVACGVVISADGDFVRIDFGPRLQLLKELIEENNEKVLVFVPFTGALDAVATELRKKWSVAIIDGGVSPKQRNQIFHDFRTLPNPHVLVCHPQTMAHGLDLTTATLSIWYAPYCKAEYFQQANARMDGSKQKVKIDIACIYATPEEKRIYMALKERGRLQDIVLDMAKNGGMSL